METEYVCTLVGNKWVMNTPADKARGLGSSGIHHKLCYPLKDDDMGNKWVKMLGQKAKKKKFD